MKEDYPFIIDFRYIRKNFIDSVMVICNTCYICIIFNYSHTMKAVIDRFYAINGKFMFLKRLFYYEYMSVKEAQSKKHTKH